MLRLDFEDVTTLVSRNKFVFGAMPALQDHGNPCGLRISLWTQNASRGRPYASPVLFVRLPGVPSRRESSLRSSNSATSATLDTGGWLALTRQGLAPCKVHQASLGALTISISELPKVARIFASQKSRRFWRSAECAS